ncbi:Piso0_001140 [Millerozyma farinosa CBS 7064]|uniref:Piso0_001140 protein n=1 Tax=Pichia sorbitophila (strain ATCC MYA-4447 / BCRC 22081 / CBS 7064 / NBRC 10061 / NRRL Y-12695) TaxID=559304 RepID=G8YSH8_PICSO|nr:Piso0_001140 [Millerozyma farinosa CBS 7064]CCE79101.1 Piso0_001140 [Millerozyma farinosa CBS 7064]
MATSDHKSEATPQIYANMDAIESAAELINATLISKGYIDEKLKFNSINWQELIEDQTNANGKDRVSRLDELEITENLYNNDRNIINIIYSLLQSIERNKVQNKAFNKVIAQKDSTIAELNRKVDNLEERLSESEMKLERSVRSDQIQLNKRIQDLTHINKLQNQDINKLKNWCGDVKVKYHMEIKKKNLEIDQLKNMVLEKRNLSTTTSMGLPFSDDTPTKHFSPENSVSSNIIYNHNPIIDNYNPNSSPPESLRPLIDSEYEKIVVDLTELIDNLINENHKFAKFIQQVNEYYSNLNNSLNIVNIKALNQITLPNPSDIINLEEIEKSRANSGKGEAIDELESFDVINKPLLNNIYKNYHYIVNFVNSVDYHLELGQDKRGDANQEKIEELKRELEIVKNSWQDAIGTLESWKKYQSVSKK